MDTINPFDGIEAIQIENPVNNIINQLKGLITSGQLKPGDRLPAERVLAEMFGVGRAYIREAILKLEFYGLLKTSPQSGTYVAGFSIKIMDSIFADLINFNKEDFASLIEARYHLEIDSAMLAAERRTEKDIQEMQEALAEFDAKVSQGDFGVNEDMLFHIKMALAAHNSVLESMLVILIPDLIKVKNIVDKDICTKGSITSEQHHKILDAIIAQDAEAAGQAMAEHLADMMSIRETLKTHQ